MRLFACDTSICRRRHMKILFTIISFQPNIRNKPLLAKSTLNLLHAIQHHFSGPLSLSIGSNINVHIFLEALVGPVVHPSQDQFCCVRFRVPDRTEFRLERGEIDWLGQSMTSKEFDKRHSINMKEVGARRLREQEICVVLGTVD